MYRVTGRKNGQEISRDYVAISRNRAKSFAERDDIEVTDIKKIRKVKLNTLEGFRI